MAVKLRLRREGAKKKPHFRVVAADHRSPRDGRFIEIIGDYHPAEDPSRIEIDAERALYWLRNGAQPTDQVRNLLRIVGVWEEFKPGDAPKRDRSGREAERAARAQEAREAEDARAAEDARRAGEAAEAGEAEPAAGATGAAEAEETPADAGAQSASAPEEVEADDPEAQTAEPVAETGGEATEETVPEQTPTDDDEDEEQS
jgi:small subunit ribosomal protein S16